MKIYVGITDWAWYDYLRDGRFDEVNFWKPSGKPFKAIGEGDLFLFKLKAAHGGKIAGGGFFTKYLRMTVDWAWRAFGTENGVVNQAQLSESINAYRAKNGSYSVNPVIGCIILNDVFYFDESEWFDAPGNWRSIVSGKGYPMDSEEGKALYGQVTSRLKAESLDGSLFTRDVPSDSHQGSRFALSMAKHRLGQGAFRALVADAYHNRCAITGERTMPVLQAAHIKPFSKEGPNAVTNGLLLRSDVHTLFDNGYITVTPQYRIHVSRRLHDDYGNGRLYYSYHGKSLFNLPDNESSLPSRDYLEWHNDCVYLG